MKELPWRKDRWTIKDAGEVSLSIETVKGRYVIFTMDLELARYIVKLHNRNLKVAKR